MVQIATWATYQVPNDLPPDTEESIVGTEWHQEAIGALADMLRDVADRRGAAWGVCEQVALVGLHYADGQAYDPRPDVFVLPRPLPDGRLAAIPLTVAGVPLFIAEIASDSTWRHDIEAKRQAYEAIGVHEYVVFDPIGGLLPEPLMAWHLEGGSYQRRQPDADGWWRCEQLGIALRPAQPLLGVRDRDGTIIAPSGEVRRQARRQEHEMRRLMVERDMLADERDALAQRIATLEALMRQYGGDGEAR
jgi:Uma2 family endonuclease